MRARKGGVADEQREKGVVEGMRMEGERNKKVGIRKRGGVYI